MIERHCNKMSMANRGVDDDPESFTGLIEMATKLGNHLIHCSFFNCASTG